MAIEELVWDMDGTLLDSGVVIPATFVRTLLKLGGPEVTPEQVIASYRFGAPAAILAHLIGRELSVEDYEVFYRELEAVQIKPYPGVARTLAMLRSSGRVVAVFTGNSTRAAATLLEAVGLEVDVLIGGDQVARPKPAGDGILMAADRLGVAPGSLAYIGDSPVDLRAASAAGSHGAAAAWGHLYDHAEPADSVLSDPSKALSLLTSTR